MTMGDTQQFRKHKAHFVLCEGFCSGVVYDWRYRAAGGKSYENIRKEISL